MPHQHYSKKILLLEPYYGGSHRAFIQGMEDHLEYCFTRVTLPPRKWKMRMQLAAPWMAEKTISLLRAGQTFDCIVCSSLLDVATFRVLLYQAGVFLPVGIYFHENQFVYPNQVNSSQSYQFSALNFTSALAADSLAFNSRYNLDTFLAGVEKYLKKAADMDIMHQVETLRRKSVILYPGMDYSRIDRKYSASTPSSPDPAYSHMIQYSSQSGLGESGALTRMLPVDRTGSDVHSDIPVIVWNHRWEHDKDPETFFRGLYELADDTIDFRLIVLGQSFVRCPAIFKEAVERLGEKYIDHFGFAPDRQEYINLMCRGSIAVSTARHEFFGMAVLEAVRCGCTPLVPDRLSYKELFPDKYRYAEGSFSRALKEAVMHYVPLGDTELRKLTECYDWSNIGGAYGSWFSRLSNTESVISCGAADKL